MFHFTRSSSCTYEFSARSPIITSEGFPHSDIPGSKIAWDLTEAFRTLQRPSSSFRVEASTVRSFIAHYENTQLCFLETYNYTLVLNCKGQYVSVLCVKSSSRMAKIFLFNHSWRKFEF